MEIVEIKTNSELYERALDLRYALFFKEPCLPREILFDALESSSRHFAVVGDGSLLAYGRLSDEGGKIFKISQMVVQPNMQGKGLGTKVLSKLIDTALELGAIEIYLNARLHAVSLYERLGFLKTSHTFVAKSTGVPHVKMVRDV
ncbi:GNAT family N-acetyltransferase [Vibrio sp. S9_S30]|uniref:GNAT family N-acetyltransferase n=1 Tax=Vibrio sp. S9_S30 TaxID=2720226 RepID=UPI0016803D97|nr:GNAT family N-acetyltransferase [Vibrio sp. S9_S30]MBD1559874.1 GNAT family N-acetyltransferase [Vibrio sp. S9_S30]